jgi:phosphatidylglycerol---prolipoprotein diacylglyceryl transferase
MMPVLLEIGPIKVYSYGFFLALSFLVTLPLLARDIGRHLAPRVGMSAAEGFQRTLDLFTLLIPLSIVGARLFYVLENPGSFSGNFLGVFALWDGGLVYYGGLFGAVVGAYFWLRRQGWPMPLFYDLAAAWILLGHAIGRVGCWFSGCCYGVVCDPAIGVVFPDTDGLAHYPTQLWEMGADLVLCATILFLRRWTLSRPWATFAVYGLSYGILRFVLEIWRRGPEDPRFLSAFLSPSQGVSALLVFVSAVVLIRVYRRKA